MENKVRDVIMPERWYDALPRRQYSSFIRTPSADPWFSVYQIRSNIYAIYEDKHFQEVISYLVAGSEKTLLIDTGLGIGNIRKVVEGLYEREIVVTHTHSHFDHIGSDHLFEEVYVLDHPVSIGRAVNGLSVQEVADNMVEGCTSQPLPRGFVKEDYCIKPAKSFKTFSEGFIFDLGDVKLKVIETPGHSPDSVMYVDDDNKLLFTGDTFYPATLYAHIRHDDGSDSSFETYRTTIHTVAAKYSDYTLITSHNEPLRPGIELVKAALAFDEIAAGESEYVIDEKGLRKHIFEDFCITTE